jgi:hypothetical protein
MPADMDPALNPPAGYSFTASTNATFVLNTQLMDYATAEKTCNVAGGHLAYYTSLDEQQEVEGFYQQQGYLLSGFTPSYWIGLTANANTWPNFRWLSSSIPAPAYHTFEHWGRTQDNSEPNNAVGNEFCGTASFPLIHKGVWGWADSICTSNMPFICRLDGEWLYRPVGGCAGLWMGLHVAVGTGHVE